MEQSNQNLEKENEILRAKIFELETKNTEIEKFFSVIAHDLKNPFNGLIGLLQVIISEFHKMSKDQILDIVIKLEKSTCRAYLLLENLLEWSKIQRGLIASNYEQFNLFAIMKECVDILTDQSNKKWIEIIYEIETNLMVYADIMMFKSIICNIVNNAIKFTPKRGFILIKSKEVDDFIEIVIKDSGIGIPKQLLQNLFTANFDLSRKGTEGEGGTGLGLIICKEFVEKQRGKIWVESIEGKGTEFHFTLPKKQ